MKLFKTIFSLAALILAALLYAVNIWFGPLNLDEGWYLYAAQSFALGELPYRDFFFTQAPMLPVVYGKLSSLWSGGGVLGGRVFTSVIGLIAAVLAGGMAAGAVSEKKRFAAVATAFLLLGCNLYHSYFTTIPKTYALASLFVVLGFGALAGLSSVRETTEREGWSKVQRCKYIWFSAMSSGFFLALAAATRLSLGALLLVVGIYLLASFKRTGLAWLAFGIGGLAGLALTLLPFILAAPEAFVFANLFHGGRETGGLIFAMGSLARLVRSYLPVVLLCLAVIIPLIRKYSSKERVDLWYPFLLISAFAVTLFIHLSSPFPYDDYNTPIMPLIAVAASVVFWKLFDFDERTERQILTLFLICSVAFIGASPNLESLFVIRKDRFWVETKKKPDIVLLREVGTMIAAQTDVKDTILTQDTYIAVEAGRRVPKGFEMGPFGYFPGVDDEKAKAMKVLNEHLFIDVVVSDSSPVAALSGYAFSMQAPDMAKIAPDTREMFFNAVKSKYGRAEVIPNFGQEHTELTILSSPWVSIQLRIEN